MFAKKGSQLLTSQSRKTKSQRCEWDNDEQQNRRLMAFVKSIQVSGDGISTGTVDALNEFSMNVDTFDYENLTFDITRLCKKTNDNTSVTSKLDHELIELENHIKITYRLAEFGRYILDIRYQGVPIPGSPFKVQIEQRKLANAKYVVAFGDGLSRCMTGKINRFHLDLRKSGQGRISVMTSTRDNKCDDPLYIITESKHGYEIQYVARTTGPFFFHIKLNGKHIPGSPFLVNVRTKRGMVEKVKMMLQMYTNNRTRIKSMS